MRGPISWLSGVVAVLGVLFFTLPDWRLLSWGLIGATSAAAIAYGIRRNQPRRRSPWFLIAVAMTLMATGDAVINLPPSVTQGRDWAPTMASALYLVNVCLLTSAVVLLTRAGGGNRDPAGVMDSLALGCGVGLLLWIFLVAPHLRELHSGLVDSVAVILFPLGDLALLATGTRLMSAMRWSPAGLMLIFGSLGLFISDLLYGLAQLDGTWRRGTPVELGWMALYVLWGAAALHPSMVELTRPRILRPPSASLRPLLLPALSCLIGPVTLLVEAVSGTVRDGLAIAICSMLVLALSIPRIAGVMITHREGLARERKLRDAAASLVSATDAGRVEATVRATVAQLMPRRTSHRTFFAVRDLWTTDPVDDAGADVLARLDETGPVTGIDLRYARTLLPESAAAEFETVLVCPLALDGLPSRTPNVGVLVIAAAEPALISVQGVVELLATQAALALDRIRLTAENKRQANNEYFRTLVQNAADIILIVDDDDRIQYASPSATFAVGDDPVGVALPDLVHSRSRDRLDALLAHARSGGSAPDIPPVLLLADGSTHIELICQDLREAPSVHGLVVTLRDVTSRVRMQRELHQLAYYDPLTGLANRTAFVDLLTAAVEQAGRSGATVGVVLLDLDEFKAVNDRFGHELGDSVLIEAAQRLSALLLPGVDAPGLPARLGSDEFAVLVEQASSPADVDELARRIVAEFAMPFTLAGGEMVTATTSVGVSTLTAGQTAPDLLRHADLALYAAKADGKARWVRYEPDRHLAMLERMKLRADLHQAVATTDLADDQFVLLFQPIVDLTTDATVGFEALLRWHHPVRGLVPPLDFIDLAEESTEVIHRLGAWVLHAGITAAAHWHHRQPPGEGPAPYVSVNVSPAQFRTPGFTDLVRDELVRAGLPPDRLLLEITESVLLDRANDVWADLRGLQELGVRVAIDDFGTGYSSLSYLQRAPVDILKLDRSFISTITTSPTQHAVVDGVLRLAEQLDMRVVAEGIATVSDRDALRQLGCHLGQGYLYAKPMPLADADRWPTVARQRANVH